MRFVDYIACTLTQHARVLSILLAELGPDALALILEKSEISDQETLDVTHPSLDRLKPEETASKIRNFKEMSHSPYEILEKTVLNSGLSHGLEFHLWAYPGYRILIESKTSLEESINPLAPKDSLLELNSTLAKKWFDAFPLTPEIRARATPLVQASVLRFETEVKTLCNRPVLKSIKQNQKPFLITGGAGFIGSRLIESFRKKNIPFLAVDARTHFQSRKEHSPLSSDLILDRDELFKFWDENPSRFKGVFHLGACTDTTELNEEYLNKMNTAYSQEIWKRCTRDQIPLVYASSAATYGLGEEGYSDEESKMAGLKPLNPYGESKLRFDLWALKEEKNGSHPPHWSGFKFFNVYGPGEEHKGKMASVVYHSALKLLNGERVRLFKSHREGILDGEQKRDFIFVEDVIQALSFAMEKPIKRGIYNLGTGKARSFLELARAVSGALGHPLNIEWVDTPVELRSRYQYFTEAEMGKLADAGFPHYFSSLEDGVRQYMDSWKTKFGDKR